MPSSSLRPQRAVALLRPYAGRYVCRQCSLTTTRGIQISSAPATEFPKQTNDAFGSAGRDDSDARFEVLGSPYSLLSVSLSASQNLFTRRGTLVSVAGKVENATSTLALLAPVRRAALGLPFLYQRISSTTPLTLLIGTRETSTTLFTLHLDGTTDWIVPQRRAVLAWTGHTLSVQPRRAFELGSGLGLGLAHWGSSFITGRGLVALSAPGYIYPVTLAASEELVVHPSHVVAYAVGKKAPQPFRLKSGGAVQAAAAAGSSLAAAGTAVAQTSTKLVTSLRLQTPSVLSVSGPVSEFWQKVRASSAYKVTAKALFDLRTILRRTVWGDRLFVHVQGPTTLLLSSRGVRVAEVLSREQVNEIADTEAGVVSAAVDAKVPPTATAEATEAATISVTKPTTDGKVTLKESKDLNEFVR